VRHANAADRTRVAHVGRRTKLNQRLIEAFLVAQLKAAVTTRLSGCSIDAHCTILSGD
jgi:hypothetical protein